MIEDPRSQMLQPDYRDELRALMDAPQDNAAIVPRFEEEDVPYSHINTRADVPEDPQVGSLTYSILAPDWLGFQSNKHRAMTHATSLREKQ